MNLQLWFWKEKWTTAPPSGHEPMRESEEGIGGGVSKILSLWLIHKTLQDEMQTHLLSQGAFTAICEDTDCPSVFFHAMEILWRITRRDPFSEHHWHAACWTQHLFFKTTLPWNMTLKKINKKLPCSFGTICVSAQKDLGATGLLKRLCLCDNKAS